MGEIIHGILLIRFLGILPTLIILAICRQNLTNGNKETKDLIYLGSLFRLSPISIFVLYIFAKIRAENEINTIKTERLLKEGTINTINKEK